MLSTDKSSEAAMPHTYRITVQELGTSASSAGVLTFDATNHDNVLQVLSRVRERRAVPDAEAAEFTIGLKLFAEVLLRHRREPLFAELLPHFNVFMQKLKKHDAAQD
jgi:Domain of Unknown Function with PDB structure (DUF3861)